MRVKRISLKLEESESWSDGHLFNIFQRVSHVFLGNFIYILTSLKKLNILFHFYIYIIAFSMIWYEDYEISFVHIHLTIALIAKFKSMLDILFSDHKEALLIRFVFMSRRVINISISYIEQFTLDLVKLELFS